MVSCEVVRPYPDRPTEGFFKFNMSFSPMASPAFGGRVSSQGIETGRVVERGLRESGAIDTEALCIVAGEKVWSVRLDMHILDDHGNLTDCCSIGAICALHHFKRPDVTISGDAVEVHSFKERDPVPLSIHHMPISISFALFHDGSLIVDPNWKEERVCQGKMTITLNAQHELCAMQKAGGVALPLQSILQASMIAQIKVNEISEAIHAALKADKLERKQAHVSSTQLMTTGVGLEEIAKQAIEDEIQAMDTDSVARSISRGLKFYQGSESLSLPDEEDIVDWDDEYCEIVEQEKMQVDGEGAKKGASSSSTSTSATPSMQTSPPPTAAPKKGPIIKQSKGPQKPVDILRAHTQGAKAKPVVATAKVNAAKPSSSSTSPSTATSSSTALQSNDEKPEGDERRVQVNRQAFERFVSSVRDKAQVQKKDYKVNKRASSRATADSDGEES